MLHQVFRRVCSFMLSLYLPGGHVVVLVIVAFIESLCRHFFLFPCCSQSVCIGMCIQACLQGWGGGAQTHREESLTVIVGGQGD